MEMSAIFKALSNYVTQSQIDEIRLGPEREMLTDLKRRYAAGDGLQSLDAQGAAPIHIAAACGYVEVIRYLLQLGLDSQLPDQDGWLPIHIAVSFNLHATTLACRCDEEMQRRQALQRHQHLIDKRSGSVQYSLIRVERTVCDQPNQVLEVIETLVAYGADLNATTKNGQTVFDICDSKELQMRLKEVWDRREDLRSAVKKTTLSMNNNGNSNFVRGFGSSRRKSNTSIMRTSMREKRRMTLADAEKERQLASAVASKENGESTERVSSNSAATPSSPKSPNVNANTANNNNSSYTLDGQKSSTSGSDSKRTPEVNGIGSTMTRRGNDSSTTVPSVPPRNTRPVRSGNGFVASPQSMNTSTSASTNGQRTKISSPSTPTDSSTVTSNSSASNSSSTSSSTTETPDSESSDSSRSNYVRPMQRNSNGQMVPIVNTTNNNDLVRSPLSQRSRPTPPSRDNRSRTPGRSDASMGSPNHYGSPKGPRSNTTAAAQLPPLNHSVLRQGPLPQPPQNEIPRSNMNSVTPSSKFVSTETLNSVNGEQRRKPFLCCHTM
ncbi:unnamed protein product [Rodentolepis nana]|uniref:ANK_REP_REGION domain-containing protein n=1 Tax=Rodentolepis nana TaxID=102285 RepID=A0A0R3T6L6_RODNA|nr:unnamed protein product [Rodentolepis nana]